MGKESLFDALPQALRALRGDRSQKEMAASCGHTQSWWSYLESGTRNPRTPDLIVLSRIGLSLVAGGWTVADAVPPYFAPTNEDATAAMLTLSANRVEVFGVE